MAKAKRDHDKWDKLSAADQQKHAGKRQLLRGHDSRSYWSRFKSAFGGFASSLMAPAQKAATGRFDDQRAEDILNPSQMIGQLVSTGMQTLRDAPATWGRKDPITGQRRSIGDLLHAPKDIVSGLAHRAGPVKTIVAGVAGGAVVAEALGEALSETVATKTDIVQLDAKLDAKFAHLETKIAESRTNIIQWIVGLAITTSTVGAAVAGFIFKHM